MNAVPERRAWSFLTVADEARQHAGNEGYDDQPDRYYSWDSTVAHHAGPRAGDICVVRDSRGALGLSIIAAIETETDAAKTRRRCPACGSTSLKGRVARRPRFRCGRCRSEFDSPREEEIRVTRYRAEYGSRWIAVDGAVTRAVLEPAHLARSQQHAIRELDPARLERALAARHVLVERDWWSADSRGARDVPAGRQRAVSWRRVGQDEFRRRLLERFGARCVISGPQPAECLHAAHIQSFASRPTHDVAAGLLLRADLHLLFDGGLLDVGPDLRVSVSPLLRRYPEISRFDGAEIAIAGSDPHRARTCEYLAARAAGGNGGRQRRSTNA